MFLVPIDHGYALPHTLEDVCFEWEFWPQAKIPYDDETKAYIASLDVEQDVEHLRSEAIDLAPASERVLRVCTVLLQKAASRGCCPADIAGMMSRPMPNRLSDLEKLASRAAGIALGGSGGVTPTPLVDWRTLIAMLGISWCRSVEEAPIRTRCFSSPSTTGTRSLTP